METVNSSNPMGAMSLKEVLSPTRTRFVPAISSKKKALEMLAHLLAYDLPSIKEQSIFNAFVERERLGSTSIGNGIAIPHARLPGLDHALGALFLLRPGIIYESGDELAVNVILGIVVPDDSPEHHLNLLATLAEKFRNDAFRDKLQHAKTPEELYQLATSV